MAGTYLRIKIEMAKNLRYLTDLAEKQGKGEGSRKDAAGGPEIKQSWRSTAVAAAVPASAPKKKEYKVCKSPILSEDNVAAARLLKNFHASVDMYNKVFPVVMIRNGKMVGADCVKEDK
jgi:hypothetical protein